LGGADSRSKEIAFLISEAPVPKKSLLLVCQPRHLSSVVRHPAFFPHPLKAPLGKKFLCQKGAYSLENP
jgi:hypothetical protein